MISQFSKSKYRLEALDRGSLVYSAVVVIVAAQDLFPRLRNILCWLPPRRHDCYEYVNLVSINPVGGEGDVNTFRQERWLQGQKSSWDSNGFPNFNSKGSTVSYREEFRRHMVHLCLSLCRYTKTETKRHKWRDFSIRIMKTRMYRLPIRVDCSSNQGKVRISGPCGIVTFNSSSKLYRKGNTQGLGTQSLRDIGFEVRFTCL